MSVPSDSPRNVPLRTCWIVAASSTLAATRRLPSAPCQLARHVPTRLLESCSLSSGRPAMFVAAISARLRSAAFSRPPADGGGGCAVPRIWMLLLLLLLLLRPVMLARARVVAALRDLCS